MLDIYVQSKYVQITFLNCFRYWDILFWVSRSMFAKKYVPITKTVHSWLFVHSLAKCMFWNWFSKNYVQITMYILFWLLGHTFWQTYFWKGWMIIQVPQKVCPNIQKSSKNVICTYYDCTYMSNNVCSNILYPGRRPGTLLLVYKRCFLNTAVDLKDV